MVAVGIDLGTTYSCVAVAQNDRAECIQNDFGKYTTPSVVAFNDDETLVGEAAKTSNCLLQNVVYNAKRFIGKQFDDPQIKADMTLSTFKVVDIEGKPHYEIQQNGRTIHIAPEKISSRVLKKLKDCAEV
ncbi:hypothetical protein WR25_09863 [Diploscapter pachys]|uniref:Uncharacterized protein n=1 Tax=Diploscapter pachys TaxID=2018661 RepID=A0A2A2JIL1_9BILA|nr:hypothetical protein WR25_09863 [Diploscapter pachys]